MTATKRPEMPGWPRLLTLALAAAYTARSPKLFADEVRAGKWPRPQRKGLGVRRITHVWDRAEIDAFIDRASNGTTTRSARAIFQDAADAIIAKGREAPNKAPRR